VQARLGLCRHHPANFNPTDPSESRPRTIRFTSCRWLQKIRSRQLPAYPLAAHCGEKANGAVLGRQMKIVATDANETVLKNTGHWVLEGGPKETTDALLKFL
jgi:hypothetical protein